RVSERRGGRGDLREPPRNIPTSPGRDHATPPEGSPPRTSLSPHRVGVSDDHLAATQRDVGANGRGLGQKFHAEGGGVFRLYDEAPRHERSASSSPALPRSGGPASW